VVTVGVFALQGDVSEHVKICLRLGCAVKLVRNPSDLVGADRLIIPGGESTTFGKLATRCGLDAEIKRLACEGMPMFGTCAGMIMMGKSIDGYPDQPTWGIMDITTSRNAYGRQLQSHITDIEIEGIGSVSVAFIRAPIITSVGKGVQILAKDSASDIVCAKENSNLVASFHPEITGDVRVHEMFMRL